jgi:hypothetical protein
MSHPDDGVLQELLDGELAPADDAVVRAHIAGCAACATALDSLRRTGLEATALVDRLVLDPPVRRPARSRPGRVNLRMLALAASTMLVAGTSWLLFQRGPEVRTPKAEPARETAAALPGADQPAQARADVPGPAQAEKRVARAPARLEEKAGEASEDVAGAAAKDEQPAAVAAPAPAVTANQVAPALAPAAPMLADAGAAPAWKVRSIEGLTPSSVEVTRNEAGAATGVQQQYVLHGTAVTLVQRPGVARTEERARLSAQGLVSPTAGTRRWERDGISFELVGALPPDTLDALVQRVK